MYEQEKKLGEIGNSDRHEITNWFSLRLEIGKECREVLFSL